MEQGYNVGSAIALGTSLQPDKTQPLTRGTGQWLQAEMNREAKKLKAEQERQKRAEMVSASWQGDGSDIPFVNEMMKQITNDFTMGSLDYINSGDLNGLQAFKREKFNELQMAKDIEKQANKFFQDVKGTNLEGSAIVFANKGNEGLQIWAQENKDLSQQLRVEGGYQTHSPIKLDLNMGDIFDRVINRSQLPLNVEEGDFKRMFERTYRAQASFADEDIATMARGMAQSVKNVENYYVQNRRELRPLVEEKAAMLMTDGLSERESIDEAKKQVVEGRFNHELKLRNSRMLKANKPQDFVINVGGVPKTKVALNITPYEPDFLRNTLMDDDIFNKIHSGGTISNQIEKGKAVEKILEEDFSNPYAIGLRANPVSGFIGLDGVAIQQPITPVDILMVTNKTTGEKKFYLYGTMQKNIIGQPAGQLLPLNEQNFSKLSTNMKDADLQNQAVFFDFIMESLNIAGSEYKDDFPKALSNVALNAKTRQIQKVSPQKTPTPQNTSGGASITADQFKGLSLGDRAKYKPNPKGNGTYILK